MNNNNTMSNKDCNIKTNIMVSEGKGKCRVRVVLGSQGHLNLTHFLEVKHLKHRYLENC